MGTGKVGQLVVGKGQQCVLLEGGTHYPVRQGWAVGAVETGKASGEGSGLGPEECAGDRHMGLHHGFTFTWTSLTN